MRRGFLAILFAVIFGISVPKATGQLVANLTGPTETLYNGALRVYMACNAQDQYSQDIYPYVADFYCQVIDPYGNAYGHIDSNGHDPLIDGSGSTAVDGGKNAGAQRFGAEPWDR